MPIAFPARPGTGAGRATSTVVAILLFFSLALPPGVAFAAPDVTPPTTTSNVPAGWVNSAFPVSLTATDGVGGSGVAATYLQVGSGAFEATVGPVTVSTEGTTPIAFYSEDTSGNIETTKTATVRIDYRAPVTTATVVASYNGTASITLLASDQTTLSGVAYTRYAVDGGAAATGTAVTIIGVGAHTLEFASTDNAGNAELTQTVNVNVIDQVAPVTTVSGIPSGWTSQTVTWSLTAADNPGGSGIATGYPKWRYVGETVFATYTQSGSVTTPQEGTKTLEFYSRDASDNIEATRTAFIRRDEYPPVTTATVAASYSGTATISLVATDALSGVAYSSYSVDSRPAVNGSTVVVTGVGSHTLTYWSTDNAGNRESASATRVFVVVDETPPSTSISGLPSVWTSQSVTFSLAATDNPGGSGVAWTYFRVGSSALTTYSVPTSITVEGTTTIDFRSVDASGNWEATRTATVRIDRTPPLTTARLEVNSVIASATVWLTAADPLSGVVETYLSLDGAQPQPGRSVTSTSAGPHTLMYWSVDAAGNREPTGTLPFTVTPTETAPPVTSIVMTPAGWTSSAVTFTLDATDNAGSGVDGVYYRLGGAGAYQTYATPVRVETEGVTPVEFFAEDLFGNREATKTTEVRIDRTRPSSSSDATGSYEETAIVSITATDALSGVAEVRYNVDGTGWLSGFTATVSSAGTHTLVFYAVDVAGNIETTREVTFHVTRTPRLVILSRDSVLTYGRPARIVGTLSDGTLPLAGRPITIEASTDGRRFWTITHATTDAGGVFRVSIVRTVRTWYRARVAADEDFRAAVGNAVRFTPRVGVTIPSVRSDIRAYRPFVSAGTLRPVHWRATIRVERFQLVGRRWVPRGWKLAGISRGPGYTRYSAVWRLPAGTWRLRTVVLADGYHARTVSGYRTFRVYR